MEEEKSNEDSSEELQCDEQIEEEPIPETKSKNNN